VSADTDRQHDHIASDVDTAQLEQTTTTEENETTNISASWNRTIQDRSHETYITHLSTTGYDLQVAGHMDPSGSFGYPHPSFTKLSYEPKAIAHAEGYEYFIAGQAGYPPTAYIRKAGEWKRSIEKRNIRAITSNGNGGVVVVSENMARIKVSNISADGSFVWNKTFKKRSFKKRSALTGPGPDNYVRSSFEGQTDIIRTSSGDFTILTDQTNLSVLFGGLNWRIIHLDQDGKREWDKQYRADFLLELAGVETSNMGSYGMSNVHLHNHDGRYLITGSYYNGSLVTIEIDKGGHIQRGERTNISFDKTASDTSRIKTTSISSYNDTILVSGRIVSEEISSNQTVWISRIDTQGNVNWKRTIHLNNTIGTTAPIVRLEDQTSFVMAVNAYKFAKIYEFSNKSSEPETRSILGTTNSNGLLLRRSQTEGYIIGGLTQSLGQQPPDNEYDGYLASLTKQRGNSLRIEWKNIIESDSRYIDYIHNTANGHLIVRKYDDIYASDKNNTFFISKITKSAEPVWNGNLSLKGETVTTILDHRGGSYLIVTEKEVVELNRQGEQMWDYTPSENIIIHDVIRRGGTQTDPSYLVVGEKFGVGGQEYDSVGWIGVIDNEGIEQDIHTYEFESFSRIFEHNNNYILYGYKGENLSVLTIGREQYELNKERTNYFNNTIDDNKDLRGILKIDNKHHFVLVKNDSSYEFSIINIQNGKINKIGNFQPNMEVNDFVLDEQGITFIGTYKHTYRDHEVRDIRLVGIEDIYEVSQGSRADNEGETTFLLSKIKNIIHDIDLMSLVAILCLIIIGYLMWVNLS
jgi:hypothetical protein